MEMDRQDSDSSESSDESLGFELDDGDADNDGVSESGDDTDNEGSTIGTAIGVEGSTSGNTVGGEGRVGSNDVGGESSATSNAIGGEVSASGHAISGEGESNEVAGAAPAEDRANDVVDLEEELYDIGIAAQHSYMSAGMVRVACRSVHEAGWRGRVPCCAHRGVVFPGEVVPMVLPRRSDVEVLRQVIQHDNLFGLLSPDESCQVVSCFGVLCEVFEAGLEELDYDQPTLTFKARATQRFRLTDVPKYSLPIEAIQRMRYMDVEVLPEYSTCDTLRHARFSSIAALRTPPRMPQHSHARGLRRLEAVATPWPPLVHEIFDYRRMRKMLQDYFKSIEIESMPVEPVSLSFWAASNMQLALRDRLALFAVDNALLRLHMECRFIKKKSLLCCSSCLNVISRKDYIFPMSSEGVYSNFVNLGGYTHDTLTVRQASNVVLQGAPSAEYSWFPGYAWTVATCSHCQTHVGWRFSAVRSSLRPVHFYGLCRSYIVPCSRRHQPRIQWSFNSPSPDPPTTPPSLDAPLAPEPLY